MTISSEILNNNHPHHDFSILDEFAELNDLQRQLQNPTDEFSAIMDQLQQRLHKEMNSFQAEMDRYLAQEGSRLYREAQESLESLRGMVDHLKLSPDFLDALKKETKKKYRSIDDPWEGV